MGANQSSSIAGKARTINLSGAVTENLTGEVMFALRHKRGVRSLDREPQEVCPHPSRARDRGSLTTEDIWHCLQTFLIVLTWGCYWPPVSQGQSGTRLQCTGQPLCEKSHPVPMSTVPRQRHPELQEPGVQQPQVRGRTGHLRDSVWPRGLPVQGEEAVHVARSNLGGPGGHQE